MSQYLFTRASLLLGPLLTRLVYNFGKVLEFPTKVKLHGATEYNVKPGAHTNAGRYLSPTIALPITYIYFALDRIQR